MRLGRALLGLGPCGKSRGAIADRTAHRNVSQVAILLQSMQAAHTDAQELGRLAGRKQARRRDGIRETGSCCGRGHGMTFSRWKRKKPAPLAVRETGSGSRSAMRAIRLSSGAIIRDLRRSSSPKLSTALADCFWHYFSVYCFRTPFSIETAASNRSSEASGQRSRRYETSESRPNAADSATPSGADSAIPLFSLVESPPVLPLSWALEYQRTHGKSP